MLYNYLLNIISQTMGIFFNSVCFVWEFFSTASLLVLQARNAMAVCLHLSQTSFQSINTFPKTWCSYHATFVLLPRETLSAFFLGGCRGTRTPKHFLNLTGEIKYFKMLEVPLNQLQTLTAFIFSDLNYKMVIFLSQAESTPEHFFKKKKHW
jgi:hypothetical protein